MREINSGTDINWYALGSLLTQLAFFVAAVWFARNFLKTLRALLEQFGASLKLSITSGLPLGAYTRRHSADVSQYWLMPTDSLTAAPIEPVQNGPGPFAVAWHRFILWLKAPMHSAEVSGWRRFVGWLQSPVGG